MWLIALIGLPLVLASADAARDLYCDMSMIRTVALRSEIGQLRSAAVRRAGRLEALLDFHVAEEEDGPSEFDWDTLGREGWLKNYWNAVAEPEPHQLYSAVVNNAGVVVLHTRPDAVGKQLTSRWDDAKVPEAGGDVVRCDGTLSNAEPAYDVHVPVVAAGRQVGTFHAGMDAAWFDAHIAGQQRELLGSRSWTTALLAAAVAGAVVGLVLLVRDFASLRRQLAREVQERARQLAQIGSGLAHEIRNPLHTIRINLHTLRRSMGRSPLSEQDMQDMLRESDSEIDQVDSLVRDLVQYTVPQAGEQEDIDLGREVQATVSLLGEELRRKEVEVQIRAEKPVVVHMEPGRLRQVALSLLTFAQSSAGPKGVVQIDVEERDGRAVLIIADSGPALSGTELARLFDPFQGTSHSRAGLGLALVQRFVEAAGGSIDRRRESATGSCFRVVLPLANHTPQGT